MSGNPRPILTNIANLAELLSQNPGVIIIKFGAVWCGPCKRIEQQVYTGYSLMPENVQCAMIDIDKEPELYSFLKKKRILSGVPGIIAYYKENQHYVPDDCVLGANPPEINSFFQRCYQKATQG